MQNAVRDIVDCSCVFQPPNAHVGWIIHELGYKIYFHSKDNIYLTINPAQQQRPSTKRRVYDEDNIEILSIRFDQVRDSCNSEGNLF